MKPSSYKSSSVDAIQSEGFSSNLVSTNSKSKNINKMKESDNLNKNKYKKVDEKVLKAEKSKADSDIFCPVPEKQLKKESIKNITVKSNKTKTIKDEICDNTKVDMNDNTWSLPHVTCKYKKFIKIETDPNGGGQFLRTDWKKIKKSLTIKEQKEFVDEFIRLSYWEKDENAIFACAIIENGAKEIEDMFEWLMKDYSNLSVKYGSLTSKQVVHVTKYKDYYQKVIENYCNGTFRYGGLEALSIVGRKKEECGDVLEPYLKHLNENIITGPIMPWGKFTISPDMRPSDSNDGPIFWVRPGEQCFTTDDIDKNGKEKPKQKYGGLRRHAKREIYFEDRTPSHADFTKCGLIKDCTGAVGILKAIRSPDDPHDGLNRILKDVVCFPAKYIEEIVQFLDINLSHPPLNQCNTWVDEAKLNQIRRGNIKYVHVSLKENCIYFLPRKVIHQFRTVSACSSIAWHARLKQYYNDVEYNFQLDHEVTTANKQSKSTNDSEIMKLET
uniref:JmjC domain-containing protein n=1 Tax=Parastrongyloides trichosuri TaxID=131310 RepID=A0A0N4Z7V0_PARTI